MKYTLLSIFFCLTFSFYGQQTTVNKVDSTHKMTFTCKFHSNINYKDGSRYSKDGYCRISECSVPHVCTFLINVTPEVAKKYDGKKVKVTGTYVIIPAAKVEYDEDGNKFVAQGYGDEVFLFNSPTIEKVKD